MRNKFMNVQTSVKPSLNNQLIRVARLMMRRQIIPDWYLSWPFWFWSFAYWQFRGYWHEASIALVPAADGNLSRTSFGDNAILTHVK